jgi:hypothetical protein
MVSSYGRGRLSRSPNALTCGSSHDSSIRCASTESRPIKIGTVCRDVCVIRSRTTNRQGAPFRAAGLGYEYPPERHRMPPVLPQVRNQRIEYPGHPVLLNGIRSDPVDAPRAVIAAHPDPRTPHDVPAQDLVMQRVEPSSGIGLGRPVRRVNTSVVVSDFLCCSRRIGDGCGRGTGTSCPVLGVGPGRSQRRVRQAHGLACGSTGAARRIGPGNG